LRNRAYSKVETKLPENFQKSAEIWRRFSGFNLCYGRMWEPAQFSKISLGKFQIMALYVEAVAGIKRRSNSL